MKKFFFALLAAVLATGALAQHSFPDIPENHWAGEAVDRAADLNIVIGFPDGTFRGNEAFTRYQAALVVSRLLDVIGTNVNAALALTNADLDALRSAVQEIASDVAAQDARLGAAESAVVGLSDDVAANSSRLDALEAVLADGGVDPAVLRDLQNQIAALRVASDNAFDVGTRALARANQNASEIAALNRLASLIGDDVKALQAWSYTVDGEGAPGVGAGDFDALKSDVASVRDFAMLIRKAQVESDRRITALEEKVDGWDFDSLEARVAQLENNMFGVSGSISVKYYVGRLSGPTFDVDRAYGASFYYPSRSPANRRAFIGFSAFSAGDDIAANGTVNAYAETRDDIMPRPGYATATLSLTFGSQGLSLDGTSSPRGLNEHGSVFGGTIIARGTTPSTGKIASYELVFDVEEFMTTFKPIATAPLVFEFGTNVKANFTPYVLSTNESGFVATVSGIDALSFIDPVITAVYTANQAVMSGGTPNVNTNPNNVLGYYRTGIRAQINAFDGVSLGGHFVRQASNGNNWDETDNDLHTTFGVDASVNISVVSLSAEYASGSYLPAGSTTATTSSAMFVKAGLAEGSVSFIDHLSANYRNIKDDWFTGYNLGTDEGKAPFDADQAGFGVNAGFGFNFGGFGIGATAYFDSYTNSPNGANATMGATAFGVDVTLTPFANIDLTGWFHSASVTDIAGGGAATAVDDTTTRLDKNGAPVVASSMTRDKNNYDTSFGVELSHSGSAANALVSGLNFKAGFEKYRADFDRTGIYAHADYDLSLGFVSLTPYAAFSTDFGSNSVRRDFTVDNTSFAFGTGITTDSFDFYTKPSFFAAVNYSNSTDTNYVGGTAQTPVNTNALQWAVGVKFSEFILDHSELTVRYGSWTENTDASGTVTSEHVSGWEANWYYYDLTMDYGVYTTSTDAGNVSTAQAFQIAYKVNF